MEKTPDLTGKVIIIPINVNSHWTLAVVVSEEYCINYFNSMGDTLENEDYEMAWALVNFFNDKYPPPTGAKQASWKMNNYKKIQYQNNSDDCGVFVLAWARAFFFAHYLLYYVGLDNKQMEKLRKIFQEELRRDELLPCSFLDSFNKNHLMALRRHSNKTVPECSEPKTLKRKHNIGIVRDSTS